MVSSLTDEQIKRYARHILLKEVGGVGQSKMLNSKVLVIGAGGLGSPLLFYLAAAGIGTIGVIDDDVTSADLLSNRVGSDTISTGPAASGLTGLTGTKTGVFIDGVSRTPIV